MGILCALLLMAHEIMLLLLRLLLLRGCLLLIIRIIEQFLQIFLHGWIDVLQIETSLR